MSSPLNVIQLEANRRNALQSTGPRTDAGKKTSSLNALRSENLDAYRRFSDDYLASLAPETFRRTPMCSDHD